jgi:hypothetical protein
MLFMLTATFKDSWYALPEEKHAEIMTAQMQHTDKLINEGKLRASYVHGNMRGVTNIFEFSSPEDVMRQAQSPTYPFMDAEITPVVAWDVAKKLLPEK